MGRPRDRTAGISPPLRAAGDRFAPAKSGHPPDVNSLGRRFGKLVAFAGDRELGAASAVLGAEHPVSRALRRQRTIERQLAVTLVVLPLAVVALGAHVQDAPLAVGATAPVMLAFLVAALVARQAVRDRTGDLIAAGESDFVLGFVVREQRRLASPAERRRVARALDGLLADARRWNRTPPPFRPLPGVECLRLVEGEAEAVIASLRGARPSVRGVALVARLMRDGLESPLYSGDPRALREELARIRFILESEAVSCRDDRIRSAA